MAAIASILRISMQVAVIRHTKRRIESLLLVTNIAVWHVNYSIAAMHLNYSQGRPCAVCTCADSLQLLGNTVLRGSCPVLCNSVGCGMMLPPHPAARQRFDIIFATAANQCLRCIKPDYIQPRLNRSTCRTQRSKQNLPRCSCWP